VVAGAYQTGVLAVRGLRRHGVRAVCFDCDPAMPGFASAHGPARRCPNPDTDPDGWVAFMVALAAELGDRPALLCSADQFVSAIARHAEALGPHYRLSPGVARQGQLANKDSQYALAEAHGMPLPRTRLAASAAEVAAFAAEARYPCLLKPIHFREWHAFPDGHPLARQKIAIAESPEALAALYAQAAPVTPRVIVQEIIEGDDAAKRVYLSCYAPDGTRTGHAVLRELRCDPVGFGPASVTEPVTDDEVAALCDGWLRRLGYAGICEIEVKRDARDGQVKLIEANPRLSGSGDAAPYAGVELAWLEYQALVGAPPAPVVPAPRAFRHVVLRADATAAPRYLRAGLLSWRGLLASYRPPLAFYDLDPADWRYSLETVLVAAKSLLRELLHALATPTRRGGTA
jgi:predicted ATP-grasp superfamily ATP-dependent carboligase